MSPLTAHLCIWTIAAAAVAGVIIRPLRVPEAIWVVAGAVLLVLPGLLPWSAAFAAARRGTNVYLFLSGMMLLSEVARREGLFDWLAAHAVRASRGSASRLFLLVYGVGVGVTVILSNDATAVVLTPAVFAVTRRAKVDSLPFLLACALVANAASFVLPISNPANLVIFDGHIPPLFEWLRRFLLPSLAGIAVTFAVLRFAERKALAADCTADIPSAALPHGGWMALLGIAATAVVLLASSAFGLPLGLPTAFCGTATLLAVCVILRRGPRPFVAEISWSILPLVAGLFVLVEAVDRTGIVNHLALWLRNVQFVSPASAAAVASAIAAFSSNLINNLPAGLIASLTVAKAHASRVVTDCIAIGIDLGPNLSVTGSLATILWLIAIRREGGNVTAVHFLKIGRIAMPMALAAALAARMLS